MAARTEGNLTMRVAVVSNTSWYLFNFRMNLMRRLVAEGHEVVAVAPRDEYSDRIRDIGVAFQHVRVSGAGVNPFHEMASVIDLAAAFRKHGSDVILSFTPKGNLYSAIGCIVGRRMFVPNVSGLGRAFTEHTAATKVARLLYRLTFRRARQVFFQNDDDLRQFVESGLVTAGRALRLPGSGVDLTRFTPSDVLASGIENPEAPIFLMVARMLWDKGVGEFVEAARAVRARYPHARFQLLGFLGVSNPSAVSREQMENWVAQGAVEYLGTTDDVREHLRAASCIVLPSYYREGVPRTLLEAAAMGKPVITTDTPGCRDTVVNGVTGYLCNPRDAADLAAKLLTFAAEPLENRRAMGQRGRAHVETHFDEEIVLTHYLRCVNKLSATGQTKSRSQTTD